MQKSKYVYNEVPVYFSQDEKELLEKQVVRIRDNILDSNHLTVKTSLVLLSDFGNSAFGADKSGNLYVNPASVEVCGFTEDEMAFLVGHELAHRACKDIETLELLQELARQNRRFLSKVNVDNLEQDILFTLALNHHLEYQADSLGRQFAAEAGYKDASVDTVLKFGSLMENVPMVLTDTHPLPQERAERLLGNKNTLYFLTEAEKDSRYLSWLVEENKKNPSNETIKLSVMEELRYMSIACSQVKGAERYISRNWWLIKQNLRDLSLRENRELHSVIHACEDAYRKEVGNAGRIQYKVVDKEYDALYEKHKELHKMLHNPLDKVAVRLKQTVKKGKALLHAKDEHSL